MQAVCIYPGVPKDPITSLEQDFIDALSHFTGLSRNLRNFARLVSKHSGFGVQFSGITDADMIIAPAVKA